MLAYALAFALSATANAQECNVAALKLELAEATPTGTAIAFNKLAACDLAEAGKVAADAFTRIVPGEPGLNAAIKAIEAGAGVSVRTWVLGMRSDERSEAVDFLSDACGKNEAVATFLLDTHAELGSQFWTQRWYRTLDECRNPGIQALLTEQVRNVNARERSQFFAVLEVFARNLRAAAIPILVELAEATSDGEELTYIVNAFADAADVGALERDPAAVEAVAVAILKIAPKLPADAVEQARTTLLSLDATEAADKLVSFRYANVAWPDGNLHYGLFVVEAATCKNGQTRLATHSGSLIEPGATWPDELQEPLDNAVVGLWGLDLAQKCKGTGANEVLFSSEPLADQAAIDAWLLEQRREAAKRTADKVLKEVVHEPVTF